MKELSLSAVDLLPGTLDLLVLKAVSLGREHGYGILLRIGQISRGCFPVQQGTLYPALYRLEKAGLLESEWGTSSKHRRAKFYSITPAGRKRLIDGRNKWHAIIGGMTAALRATEESI